MILFIADIHIKVGQKNVPRDWAINRYNMFIEQMTAIPHDKLILGGDIFDKLPTLDELAVYFNMVKAIKEETELFDGNHEATKKNATFFDALRSVTESLNPKVKVITKTTECDGYSILPYADLHKKDSVEKCKGPVLFTHIRGEIPPHVKPEIDLKRLERFDVVYAGDLHSHSNTQRNIVYPGSPMTTSFHRGKVDTGYLLIDENDLTKWTWHKFDLPQLIRKTVTSTDEMIPTDYDHTIYEIEGNLQELSNVTNSELLDKKIVKRQATATLNISAETSMQEEVHQYLTKVLELDKRTIEGIMEVFNAYAKNR